VIVQTALTEGTADMAGQAALAASLGGVAAMLRPAAQELAALGVRVMALASGAPEIFATRVAEIVRTPGLSGTVAPLVAPLPPAPAQGRAGA
jgi:NAD(P)-dependent dehydrogenase (short-subunit alcohol dehydrogenase family)